MARTRSAPHVNIVWDRLSTSRETMFGLRSDRTVRRICSNLEIRLSMKIEQDVLERCAEHFNKNMCCFHEFLMEKKESKEIWLVKRKENKFMVKALETETEIEMTVFENQINCRLRAEYGPNWKLYCNYIGYYSSGDGYDTPEGIDSKRYPHVYQLIFVFCTGTLDELSCALICNLFLNILDCALRDVPLPSYSHLKMYDVDLLENKITQKRQAFESDKQYHENSVKIYTRILQNPCSNFKFKKREFENKDRQFKTMGFLLSHISSQAFANTCKEKNVGLYAAFIVIINNALLHHVLKNGFKGTFYTKVLHIIDARYLLKIKNSKFPYEFGSHSLPFMFFFKLESTDSKEIFKEACRVEKELSKLKINNGLWDQEALREHFIKESGGNYNSCKWNPHYCFSVTNLGKLDRFFSPEKSNNKFRVLSYERSSSALESGHFDVIFYSFKGKYKVQFDYSNEYFSDNEMEYIVTTFGQVIQSLAK